MIVDAHQHFWSLGRGDYDWLTPQLEPLYRDFLPADLRPLLSEAGVRKSVLVQAAATEAETRYLLGIARTTDFVAGVVGWVDMAAKDAPARIAGLKAEGMGCLKGIRPMIQDIADDRWVASAALDAAFQALIDCELTFDALVFPRHLEHLRRRLDRHPDLRVVIDHCAKPDIAAGAFAEWSTAMHSLARNSQALCKLSGQLSQLSPTQTSEHVRPYAQQVLHSFGPKRVMWGSDWPGLNCNGDYATWLAVARSILAGLPAQDASDVLGGNAVRFYSLAED
ncbi:amidohydrolase family protein [Steroidobacter sp.]|uniref:amidohydrolase family protein n=1 Tax=Steroidobacter sp. TaxID=1978227 RepID=UPI001A3ED517|nr:amidohydrolase family protein [Steroidobacter sp.]MBL8270839.1 amidohydrolase family protein [Steroidobacter sp.]